jgi:transposase InsO family protein
MPSRRRKLNTSLITGLIQAQQQRRRDRHGNSAERTRALAGWIHFYNHHRPHGALSHKPPIARLNELNNLAGFYT